MVGYNNERQQTIEIGVIVEGIKHKQYDEFCFNWSVTKPYHFRLQSGGGDVHVLFWPF